MQVDWAPVVRIDQAEVLQFGTLIDVGSPWARQLEKSRDRLFLRPMRATRR